MGLLCTGQAHDWRSQQDIAIHRGISRAIEEGIHRVKLLLADGVILVVMTHRAACRQPHPHRHGGVRAINCVAMDELLVDRSTLAGRDIAAIESRGDRLLPSGIGQKITRKLPQRKLVIGQVFVEGLHDPIAIRPHAAFIVQMQPVGICVASGVQPIARHVFAVVIALQKPCHHTVVSTRGSIGNKGIDLRQGRRQSRQIQGDTTDERFTRRLRCGCESLFCQP